MPDPHRVRASRRRHSRGGLQRFANRANVYACDRGPAKARDLRTTRCFARASHGADSRAICVDANPARATSRRLSSYRTSDESRRPSPARAERLVDARVVREHVERCRTSSPRRCAVATSSRARRFAPAISLDDTRRLHGQRQQSVHRAANDAKRARRLIEVHAVVVRSNVARDRPTCARKGVVVRGTAACGECRRARRKTTRGLGGAVRCGADAKAGERRRLPL